MKRSHITTLVLVLVVAATLIATASPVASAVKGTAASKMATRRITRTMLDDKIRGGWAGQMIGVSYGAPTEFKSNGKIITTNIGNYQTWTPERIANAIVQDDLYVEMTFAEVMDRSGLSATTEQYGEMFKDSKYHLWHANAGARRLLNSGIKAPLSGHPKYNIHANDIDFQIEADFIGLMTPGLPQEANKYCDLVGRVMNYGDGLYGGMFVTGMYAAAFFEKNPRKVVEQGLLSIPPQSGYARVIRDVLDWSAQHPNDWQRTWSLLKERWDKDDPCTDGALQPFNIDARLNGAHIALGLLYGKSDFTKTLDISTRAGQDSDCNPSNAVGVLGVMLGYSGIPDEWKAGIPAIADKKFDYTNYSFNDISRSTLVRALKVIEGVGGKVTADEVMIPVQAPKAPKLEQWDMGVPDKIIAAKDSAWSWKSGWAEEMGGPANNKRFVGMIASAAGAEATLQFTGTAVALVGKLSQAGGQADVYLDDKKVDGIDAFSPERTNDNDLWHAYDLRPGTHTIRIVTRDDKHPQSKGTNILVENAITYRSR